MNQAKRIVEKYDDILYRPAPELLVNETHSTIRALLKSPECRAFIDSSNDRDEQSADAGDQFVRKIMEAVSPILPVALRNKSLDGAYLRTALYVLGAAEIMFAQYEEDARVQANPAGAVGLCRSMHSEIERSTLYGDQELKPLREFYSEMKAQYQTSLGLGKSFAKDTSSRGRRRSRRGRGSGQFQGIHYAGRQGLARGLRNTQVFGGPGYAAARGGYSLGHAIPNRVGATHPTHLGGRAPCYDFQAGNCLRGRACRFAHVNQ